MKTKFFFFVLLVLSACSSDDELVLNQSNFSVSTRNKSSIKSLEVDKYNLNGDRVCHFSKL